MSHNGRTQTARDHMHGGMTLGYCFRDRPGDVHDVRLPEIMSNDSRDRLDLEERAHRAEHSITDDGDHYVGLQAAIDAAELYMQALRLADNPRDRKRLDEKTKGLITKAEELKRLTNGESPINSRLPSHSRVEHPVSTRKLTTRENIILLEGAKLNGAIFKPWAAPPSADDFELKDGKAPYADDLEFSLSETQLKHFAGWERPRDALAHIKTQKDGETLLDEVTMFKLGAWDMVQDVAPDCSVVASFCVGSARAEKGHSRIFGSIIYPYDHTADQPRLSPNGRYVLRLYFNGCWRRVDIDDRLPTSKSTRVLHVIDRSHPGMIWPAIVEKGYLKIRGGYDFPGSNSGTDLAVLIGWIPQQLFLHDENVDPLILWKELLSAFANGEVLITLGTGKLGRREQQQLGLGAEHDYAVLELQESAESCELLIKNPWTDGDVWKGALRCRPHPGHENNNSQAPTAAESMKPGTFWMDFNSVFQYFEHMYLNWDPSLFRCREDLHFSWHLPEIVQAGNLLVDHPQFAVRSTKAGEIWILLNRHFRTGDFSVQNHGKNGYISLYLFHKNGGRVFSSESAKVRGPFVDSPNTLLRFKAHAMESYSVVVVSQDLPAGKHNFTISAFSKSQVEISNAYDTYREPQTLTAAWTRSTAGGSSDSPRYLQNPQFTMRIDTESRVVLVLKSLLDISAIRPNANIHVKILIVVSNGQRITKTRQRDVVANSGDYKRGSTVIETALPRGIYTIICSTFEQDQLSKFKLDLHTTLLASQAIFRPLPAEGSGRLSIAVNPAVFTGEVTKLIAPMVVTRVTKALFKASLGKGSSSSMFKMSIEQGQGPYRRTVVSSTSEDAEYSTIASGLRIEDIDLNTNMTSTQAGGLWLVVEKPKQSSTEVKDTNVLQVEVLSEERLEIGQWAPLED